jgi:hypothetical protein
MQVDLTLEFVSIAQVNQATGCDRAQINFPFLRRGLKIQH